MAEFGIYKLVYVLFVTSATTGMVNELKPYRERTFDEPEICHPLRNKKDDRLSSERNSSLIVKHAGHWDTWQPYCRFKIKAAKGEQLMAVIQNMYLRTNGSECLDYITFRRKDRRQLMFCGQIDRSRAMFKVIKIDLDSKIDMRDEGPDAFGEFDSEGEIDTTIKLSGNLLKEGEKLDLSIAYTPYKACNKIKSYIEDYRNISIGNHTYCMWKKYFCDGYQNCLPTLCRDEEGCPTPTDIVSHGTGTKVTIGAVTTLFLCFVIFVMGLWICRKHKKMCWSTDCAGPSLHENRLPRTEREAHDVAHPSVAVSPMLEVAVLPSGLDKDLPPSYDSLFPEQSNPSAT